MPAKGVKVHGERDAIKKLQNIKDNSLRVRTIVSAAKSASKRVERDMKMNMASVDVEGSERFNEKIGRKKIPKSYGGDEWPGAWIGLKKKNDFTLKTSSGGALSIYWIEYGTDRRHNTIRDVGSFPKSGTGFAPMRNAIKNNVGPTRGAFSNSLIKAINNRVKRNSL